MSKITSIINLPFNGNANDVSGNGYHGTVYGATLTTDRFGNPNSAYEINASGEYIELLDSAVLDLSVDFTLNFWLNVKDLTKDCQIFSNIDTDSGCEIRYDAGYNAIVVEGYDNGTHTICGFTYVYANRAKRIGITVRSGAVEAYIDNQKVETYNLGNEIVDVTTNSVASGSTISIPDVEYDILHAEITGGTGQTYIGSSDEIPAGYTPIWNLNDLDNIRNDVTGNYILMADIDASPTAEWNYNDVEGYYEGFEPIPIFSGILDGNNYNISGLYINRPSANNIGMFSTTNNVYNVKLHSVNITGNQRVGGISGLNAANIINCSVHGTITGIDRYIGGLVGETNIDLNISNCNTNVTIVAFWNAGGIVGFADSDVDIDNVYSINDITGSESGSFIGWARGNVVINNSYAAPSGRAISIAKLEGSATKNSSYYDSNISGTTSVGERWFLPKTTAEMQQQSTFVGWDFDNVWRLDEGNDYPRLRVLNQLPQYSLKQYVDGGMTIEPTTEIMVGNTDDSVLDSVAIKGYGTGAAFVFGQNANDFAIGGTSDADFVIEELKLYLDSMTPTQAKHLFDVSKRKIGRQ